MRNFPNYLLITLGAIVLASCNVTTPKEVKVRQNQFRDSMNLAIQKSLDDDWAAAESHARSAHQNLPIRNLTESEDGHYAYLTLQARSLEAFSRLARGKVQEAKRRYQNLFEDLKSYERFREENFRDRVTSARMWEAFGFAMFAAASAHDSGAPASLRLASALQVASESLSRPLAGGVDSKLLANAELESDGVRLTILPTVGPFALIGRLYTRTGTCTASLVGEALALTNAHCVTEHEGVSAERGRWPIKTGPIFLTFEGLYAPDRVNVAEVILHEDGFWNIKYQGDFRDDWAILKLDRHPAGRGWFGVVEERFEKRQDLFVAGHSGDLNDGRFLTVDWNCDGAADGDQVVHSCRGAPGRSGAPILVTSGPNKLRYLIGVHAFGGKTKRIGGGPAAKSFGDTLRKLAGQV